MLGKQVDQEKVTQPFRPRARLLQLLGDQLIGTPRLAVFELVKNGYDADAESVTVTLKGLETPNPKIVIEDNGEGMSLETIRDIWLVPAHDHREAQRKSMTRTKKNRLPLGEKGVGRFAVHKLGDRIELITRAKTRRECVVTIDWDSLIEVEFLSDAKVTIIARKPEIFTGSKTGTKLIISRLRERKWSRGDVRRLSRQVTSISSPFSQKASRSDIFKVDLVVPDHPEWVAGIPDVKTLINRAPWHYKFSFIKGVFEWSYEFRGVTGLKLEPRKIVKKAIDKDPLLIRPERDIDVYGEDQKQKSSRPRKIAAGEEHGTGIGPVSGEFFVFDRDREILRKLGDSQLIENFLNENGGVRVYRDNIRVYNYGEPGDDWLGLDLRRVNIPTRSISRNIIIGAVDLELWQSTALTEKTNREGFVENDAYRRFQEIVLGALSKLEVERKIDKDNIRAVTGKGQDQETRSITQPLQKLREIAKKHRLSKEIDPLIEKAEKGYNDMRDAMLTAGMSGMGLAIVFHEIERGVRILLESIETGITRKLIQVQASELAKMLDGFTELLRKSNRKSNSIKHLVRRARDINNVRFRSHSVELKCPILEESSPDAEHTFAFNLLLGALNNLLDNAFYWLRVRWPDDTGKKKRKIYINYENDFPDGPAIIVADNGPGFEDDPERLTRPFFSRRPDGMGVGLYYTNMVLQLSDGRLIFPGEADTDAPEDYDGAVLALVFGKGKTK